MKRKSTFVVYDDPRLYIPMSLMLNSATHRDRHLSTMAKNMQKLRQIWIHYGRTFSLIRAHDDRRASALVSAASAVRKLPPIDDDATITTKVMARILVDLTHQAWHPSDECFEAILQVCKDYENGFLWHNKEDERRWKLFAKRKELDAAVDTRPKRIKMAPN